MDYLTSLSAQECLPCSLEHFRALAAAMNLDVREHASEGGRSYWETTPKTDADYDPHGLELYFAPGELFLFGDDYASIHAVTDDAWAIVGTILQEAGRPYLELGIAHHASRNVPGSMGGGFVRITDQGEFVEPTTVWPDSVAEGAPRA